MMLQIACRSCPRAQYCEAKLQTQRTLQMQDAGQHRRDLLLAVDEVRARNVGSTFVPMLCPRCPCCGVA